MVLDTTHASHERGIFTFTTLVIGSRRYPMNEREGLEGVGNRVHGAFARIFIKGARFSEEMVFNGVARRCTARGDFQLVVNGTHMAMGRVIANNKLLGDL